MVREGGVISLAGVLIGAGVMLCRVALRVVLCRSVHWRGHVVSQRAGMKAEELEREREHRWDYRS